MPTTNPVPSTDPTDLLFNAGKLDEVVNGIANSFTDRLGIARRTVAGMNADFDAQLADAESDLNVYRAQAAASATEALAYLNDLKGRWYGALASDPAADPLGAPVGPGDAYFNTTLNQTRVYSGSSWQAPFNPTDSSQVAFQQSGTGAVATNAQEKLRQSVNVWDYMTPAQKADLASGAGLVDMLPAVYSAMAAALQPGPFVYPVSGKVEFPRGKLFLNGNLTLSSSVHFTGHGSGQQGGNWATILKFPENVTGIIPLKANTGPNQNGADGSIIEGFSIQGGGGTLGSAHGVDMQARIKLRDVTVSGFSGNGVNIVADVGARKNANCWIIDTVALLGNGMHGLYVQGGDTNAGYAVGIDATGNGGWGIWDASFLGNTYVGCHTDGNGKRSMVHYGGNRYYCLDSSLAGSTTPGTNSAVWALIGPGGVSFYHPDWVSGATYLVGGAYASTGINARNVFIGCYSESGSQPPSDFIFPSIVIGGLHAAGVTNTTSATILIDGSFTTLTSMTKSNKAKISIGAGSAGDSDALLTLADPVYGDWPYRLKYATGRWLLNWANTNEHLHLYTRDATVTNGYSRNLSSSYGGIGFPNGYFGGFMKFRGEASAPPSSGTWLQGDIMYNTSPSAGGFVGWVCVSDGTPGTWKTFGAISA